MNKNTLSNAFLCCLGRLSHVPNMFNHFILWPQKGLFWHSCEDPWLVLASVLIEAEIPSAVSLSFLSLIDVLSEFWTQKVSSGLKLSIIPYNCRSLLLFGGWIFCFLGIHRLTPGLGETIIPRMSQRHHPSCKNLSGRTSWDWFLFCWYFYVCFGPLYQWWHKQGPKQCVNYI